MVEAAPVLDAPMPAMERPDQFQPGRCRSEWSGCNLAHWTAFPEATLGGESKQLVFCLSSLGHGPPTPSLTIVRGPPRSRKENGKKRHFYSKRFSATWGEVRDDGQRRFA